MPVLSVDELKALVETAQSPCVSIYMPAQKAGPEVRQNPIRFKNLIREAENRLEAMGMEGGEAAEFLKPAHELDTVEFWENQDRGLVILLSPGEFRYYQLPYEFQELVVVSDRFHLKPLLHLINNDGRFYILALSQKDARFYEATHDSIKEIEVENMPKSLDEALQEDELDKGIQQRIATSRGGTSNPFSQPGSFHGMGSPDVDKRQRDIIQFCNAIDGALHEKLRNQKAPLVLAGVEYLHPLYKEVNTYSHLVEEGITGNPEPEAIAPEELRDRVWQIVEPIFHQKEQQAIERYQELAGAGTGKASNDIKEIISAAYFQRVDSLIVPVGRQMWGGFDPDTMSVDLHPEPQPADEDMLDFAAIHTLLNGGTVYAVQPEQLPEQAPAAAIFRY